MKNVPSGLGLGLGGKALVLISRLGLGLGLEPFGLGLSLGLIMSGLVNMSSANAETDISPQFSKLGKLIVRIQLQTKVDPLKLCQKKTFPVLVSKKRQPSFLHVHIIASSEASKQAPMELT